MDHLGLVEAVDGLGQRVVVGIADAADGRFDPCFGEALGVADGNVLGSPVAMMNQPGLSDRPAVWSPLCRLLHMLTRKRSVKQSKIIMT